jgi:hypothetical protein
MLRLTLLGLLALSAACAGKSESDTSEPEPAPKAGANGAGSSAGAPASASAPASAGGQAGAEGKAGAASGTGGMASAVVGVVGGTYGTAGANSEETQVIYLDCSAYARCSLEQSNCPTGSGCYGIPGCKPAICATDLCSACPGDCIYLQSLPSQVGCEGAEYQGIE